MFFTDAIKPVFCTVSLAGEPTLSPILGQLLKDLKERGFVTFVVSNGTRMHKVKDLKYLPDQFYLSISAIDRKSFDYLCNPIDPSDWDRFIDGLEILRNLNTRTVARVLFLKGFTENRFNELAILIRKALPSYVELKAYEHRGASTKNFQTQCVPSMLDIEKGAKKIASETGYIISLYESRSRVALLCRDSYAESNRLLLGVA